MILVNSLAYGTLVISFVLFLQQQNHIVSTGVFTLFTCTCTGLLTYSMIKLRKFSSLLAADGILASKRLLGLHVTCFWICSGLEIASLIVTIMLDQTVRNENGTKAEMNNLALTQ